MFSQLSSCDLGCDGKEVLVLPFVLRKKYKKKSIYQDSAEKRPGRHYGDARCELAIQQSAWRHVHAITRPVPTPAGNTGPRFTFLSPAPWLHLPKVTSERTEGDAEGVSN